MLELILFLFQLRAGIFTNRMHGSGFRLKETMLGAEQDSVSLLDEEADQPVKRLAAAAALEMTPQHVAMPTPPRKASKTHGDEPAGILDEEVSCN